MGMHVGGHKSGRTPTPDVNVTPLVDVTLVVLIIFMVMTPLMTKTFWLNLPKKPDEKVELAPPSKDNEPLVLTLDKQGIIRVNKAELKREELASRLPRMMAAKKNKVLYFDAHDQAPYGAASQVMDAARAAGAKSIAILTKSVVVP